MIGKRAFAILLLTVGVTGGFNTSEACTNVLVTKGASVDGSTIISYSADSHDLYGELYYWPGREWPEGEMLNVYEWDTGKYLGQIHRQGRPILLLAI